MMMPPLYRIIETIVYSLLNFLPFLLLALYPFRKHFRYPIPITGMLTALATLLQVSLGLWASR